MRLHFDPGSRYAYSGEGYILMQFVLETGLGLEVGDEMQRRVFNRFGMTRTSMMWREDFAANLADGYGVDGSFEAHSRRSRPRAAGSMDTTIDDFAKFLAGFVRGAGLSARSRAEMVKPQIPIATPSQFPTFLETSSPAMQAIKLSAGLGVITFEGPYGRAFSRDTTTRPATRQSASRQPGDACCTRKRRACGESLSAVDGGDARRSGDAMVVGGIQALRGSNRSE